MALFAMIAQYFDFVEETDNVRKMKNGATR